MLTGADNLFEVFDFRIANLHIGQHQNCYFYIQEFICQKNQTNKQTKKQTKNITEAFDFRLHANQHQKC
jgi:hypothetical protein